MTINGITTCLWFDTQAKDAAEFYVATFPESKITSVEYYPEGGQMPAGTVLTAQFELFGQPFMALNGGPVFTHSPAVSFTVFCDTQDELDRIWETLIADGGSESQCGWCADRFGVSWQVVPSNLPELLAAGGWSKLMQMKKIVIAELAG